MFIPTFLSLNFRFPTGPCTEKIRDPKIGLKTRKRITEVRQHVDIKTLY